MAVFINEFGNQTYRGTAAEYDQVDYAGFLQDYSFTQNADGSVTVQHPIFGTDTLLSIEGFWFQGESRWYSMEDALALSPSNGGGGTTPPPPTDGLTAGDVDFVAFAGQSNAANMFFRLDGDRRSPTGDQVFETSMNNLTGFTTEAINAAYGATGSNETADANNFWWNLAEDRPGQVLLDSVQDIQRALENGQDLDAIVWSQGESDAYSIFFGGNADLQIQRMVEATTNVFEYFRAEFGQDIPIFIQEMGEFEVPVQLAPGQANAFDLVRDAQLQIAQSDPNIFMGADTTGTPIFRDGLHYTTETYGEIATDHAETIVSVLGQDNPVNPPVEPPVEPPVNEITGTAGNDLLLGTAGNDIFNSLQGSDTVIGSGGNDTISLGAGYDQVDYAAAASDYTFTRNGDGSVTVTKPGGAIDTLNGVDGFWFQGEGAWYSMDAVLVTFPGGNTGGGNTGGGTNTINGTAGDDQLFTTAGDDIVQSLLGSDVVIGSSGSDVINLGDGYDQVDYAGSSNDYNIVRNDDGSYTVTKPGGDVDTLIGVDGFWFQGEAAWYRIDDLAIDLFA